MQQASSEPLRYRVEQQVARIHFNRPDALNALDVPTARGFAQACRAAAGDPTVRAVVISGEGRAFSVGGDLACMREDPVDGAALLIDPMHEGIGLLAEMDAPVVASLAGLVAGGGLGGALAADLAIAGAGARFSFAYTQVGVSPDCSTSWQLPRVVGLRHAMEIALLGDRLDAEAALRLGLVNRVVPDDALEQEVDALAQRLAAGPTRAYGETRRLLRASFDRPLDVQLDAERKAFLRCARTEDFTEGMSAFFAKRAPWYCGR
ncbi:enoyl-CoA hydratase/isomerase family protein [Burkholderia lata]|uniref:Enoyl-CoA hydratase n=1 Tax=Burkholderia lata (strain ATCC 17760 / DSM 23089 / LMG 22485 / NCIMB 9086 / R18194 / 383) TaxID=482957 RepID=Q39P29_BURL3|nr:enoyl-CoA hydratase-related protein [Burkholderia lata]ABB05787.1 Enoyl-CoA hydratase [Burkholderia lata]